MKRGGRGGGVKRGEFVATKFNDFRNRLSRPKGGGESGGRGKCRLVS